MGNDLLQKALQIAGQYGDLSNTQAPIVGGIRNMNQQMFGMPAYADNNAAPRDRMMDLVNRTSFSGGTRAPQQVNPAVIKNAVALLRGKITPSDRDLFGKFAQSVETNKARGNLGETGQLIQSFIQNAFGKESANWNNRTVKNALDMLLKGIDSR